MQKKKQSHRLRNSLLLVVGGVILVGVVLAALLLPRLLTSYVAPTGLDSLPTATAPTAPVSEADIARVEQRLRAVGLADSGYLDTTGVEAHVERLRNREVSLEAIEAYASHLESLMQTTAAYGQAIPVTFWDVRTSNMTRHGLTEYEVLDAIAGPDSPYLALLARAYNRLYAFKADEPGSDSALDTALDILHFTVSYYDEVTDVNFESMDAGQRLAIAKGIIGVWQQVMFGTTRDNPLTGDPMFSHSIFGHFNITSMWHYHTGENASVGEIWGVSGFDQRFVGEPENDNQVEHMTISATLQLALEEPLAVLNGIEEKDILTGRESTVQARADQTLNSALADAFIPRFVVDYSEAVGHLRCVLSSSETEAAACP